MTGAAAGSAPDRPSRTSVLSARWPATILCSALALALVALGVPRTIAAWSSMDGTELFDQLSAGGRPTDAQIANAVSGLERAVAWVPSGSRYYTLATLEFEQYRRLPDTDPGRAGKLATTEKHLTEGLALSPTDGGASLMLATARLARGAPVREIAVAVLQAIDTTPNFRLAWPWRTILLYATWSALTPDEQLAMNAHLRTIWNADPRMRRQLVEAANIAGQAVLLSYALADEPEGLAELQRIRDDIAAGRPTPLPAPRR